MTVGVGAHDDEARLIRARLSEQAHAGRTCVIGRNALRDDPVPTQVTHELLRVGMMLAFGGSKDLDAALELGKKRQGKSDRPRCLATAVPGGIARLTAGSPAST
jgi:hypothetical protein